MVAVIGITTAGTFMILPFLTIFLVRHDHLSVSAAGLVLGALVVIQRGGNFLTGIASDRYSPRLMMTGGTLISAVGFLVLSSVRGEDSATIAVAVLGIGSALFLPACKSVLAASSKKYGNRAFTLRTTVTNMGAAVGPLIGGLFFAHFAEVLVATALLYVACTLAIGCIRIIGTAGMGVPRSSMRDRFALVMTDRSLLGLTAASVGFWICYTQFNLTLPLYAAQVLPSLGYIGLLTTLSAVIIVSLQFLVFSRFLKSAASAMRFLAIGMLFMVAAFVFLMVQPGLVGLILFTCWFSISEMIVLPCLDLASYAISRKGNEAAYLGFTSVGWAVGGLIGNPVGAQAFSASAGIPQHFTCWLIFGSIAALTALSFAMQCSSYRSNVPPVGEKPLSAGSLSCCLPVVLAGPPDQRQPVGHCRVLLSERCVISGRFGHAARLRSSMVAGS